MSPTTREMRRTMARGTSPARATRVAGGTTLLVAVASAAALAGAAFFTVDQASCDSPASYVRIDGQIELVDGCVDTAELPAGKPTKAVPQPGDEPSGFYRP